MDSDRALGTTGDEIATSLAWIDSVFDPDIHGEGRIALAREHIEEARKIELAHYLWGEECRRLEQHFHAARIQKYRKRIKRAIAHKNGGSDAAPPGCRSMEFDYLAAGIPRRKWPFGDVGDGLLHFSVRPIIPDDVNAKPVFPPEPPRAFDPPGYQFIPTGSYDTWPDAERYPEVVYGSFWILAVLHDALNGRRFKIISDADTKLAWAFANQPARLKKGGAQPPTFEELGWSPGMMLQAAAVVTGEGLQRLGLTSRAVRRAIELVANEIEKREQTAVLSPTGVQAPAKAVRDALRMAGGQSEGELPGSTAAAGERAGERPDEQAPARTKVKSPRWTKRMMPEARASVVLLHLAADPGMTDGELADRLGVSTRTLQRWKSHPVVRKAWPAASRAVLPPRAVVDSRTGRMIAKERD